MRGHNVFWSIALGLIVLAGAAGAAGGEQARGGNGNGASDAIEEGRKKFNGVELYYKTFGRGDPVVVLHGGPGLDHTILLPQLGQLAKNHRLIFYDQRACGQSSGTFDVNSINVDVFVDDLDGIRQAFGIERMNLLGFSWGGLLAMSYGVKHPERLQRLMLIDSAEANSADGDEFPKVLRERRSATEQQELDRIRNSGAYKSGDPKAVEQSLRLGFRAYFFNADKVRDVSLNFTQKSAKAFIEVGNLFDKTLFDPGYDLTPKLPNIKCPTLIVHGDYDPIRPKYLKGVAALIKGSRFEVLSECGHFSYVEQPGPLFRMIDQFLMQE
jgi:proline iminopeptidase